MIRSRVVAIESAWAGGISLLLALLFVGPVLPLLDSAWFTADMLAQYVTSEQWGVAGFTPTTQFGFPFGLDYNYFPNGDVIENAFTHTVNAITGSPFVGVNLLILVCYPIVGALALVLLRMTRLGGPLAVALAVAIALLPFHVVGSLNHAYVSTMVPVVTGLLLVLLVASGRLAPALMRRRGRAGAWIAVGVLCLVTGWMGFYYAVFTVLLGLGAVVLRYAKRDRWRDLAISVVPFGLIVVLMVVGQIPLLLARTGGGPTEAVAGRVPLESVRFAGALITAVIPGPLTSVVPYGDWIERQFADAPLLESVLPGNFGTMVTTAALLVFLGGLVVRSRRGLPMSPPDRSGVTPGVIAWLLGTALLLFIPWGLNFAVAVLVTPSIRSWNRLLPVLLILFVLGAATIIRDAPWLRAGRANLLAGSLVIVVVALEVVVPSVRGFGSVVEQYSAVTDRARAYGAEVNAAIPGDCGMLQLPLSSFPEPEAPYGDTNGYENLWPSLTNPGKNWSFGAMKYTDAAAWQSEFGGTLTPDLVDRLVDLGFCGVHLDTNGFAPSEALQRQDDLTTLLGEPVAVDLEDGWVAWRLPGA